MQRGLVTGLIFGVILVVFALQNAIDVSVKFLLWQIPEIPLVLLLLSAILIGVLINALSGYPAKQRLKKDNRKLKERIDELEEQLLEYRQDLEDLEEEEQKKRDEGDLIQGNSSSSFFDD
jgi:lipopolysaccharide assembly protein A